MKKVIRNSVCVALALTALCLTACEGTTTPTNNTNNNNAYVPPKEEIEVVPPKEEIQYTGHLLAQNGSTNYSIVIGTDADQYEEFDVI